MSIIATYIVPHPPLIVPNIGRGEERHIQDTINAYHKVAQEIAKIEPDTIIISSPHSQYYADYFHLSPHSSAEGDFRRFGAPELKFKVNYDDTLVKAISLEAKHQGISAGTSGGIDLELDHGTTVPLFFINQYYQAYKLIRISPSGLSPKEHYKLGKLIQSIIPENKKVVWVASGDLSHKLKKDGPYGFAKEGPVFDKEITEAIAQGDFMKFLKFNSKFVRKAAECGLGSFAMMAGVIHGYNVKPSLLSYEGPFGVGYAVASFEVLHKDESRLFDELFQNNKKDKNASSRHEEDPYVKLARDSLEYYVKNKKVMKKPNNLIADLINEKAGVFVSIHKHGLLRGCVGTIKPTTDCIADEIIQMAIGAGMRDPRFQAVKHRELSDLKYKVDVLSPFESIESMEELDVKKYGVIVYNNYKSGLLLPNLDGIDTIEEQVRIAKQKAGIRDNETFRMERFEVIRHK